MKIYWLLTNKMNLLPKAYTLLLVIFFACSKNSDTPTPIDSATINGTALSITSPTATAAFGNEVSINLTAGNYAIAAYLSDRAVGTYTVQKGAFNGRSAATQVAYVSVVDGQSTYAGVNGTVTLSVDAKGRIGGTFSFTALGGGKTINIAKGSFSGLSIGNVLGGQCFFNFNGVPFSSTQGFAYCTSNFVIADKTTSVAVGTGNSTVVNTWIVYAGLTDGTPVIQFIPNSSNVAGSIFINSDINSTSESPFNGSVVKVGNTYTFSGKLYDYVNPNSSPAFISGVIRCK